MRSCSGSRASTPRRIPARRAQVADHDFDSLPKLVFSRSPRGTEWNNCRLARGDVVEEISRLKRRPGRDIALFGSANLAASLIRHGLIDEYRIPVSPVIRDGGTGRSARWRRGFP